MIQVKLIQTYEDWRQLKEGDIFKREEDISYNPDKKFIVVNREEDVKNVIIYYNFLKDANFDDKFANFTFKIPKIEVSDSVAELMHEHYKEFQDFMCELASITLHNTFTINLNCGSITFKVY